MYETLIKPLSLPMFPFMGKIRHESKKTFLPLQAADMQAGWIRRFTSLIQVPMSADTYLSQLTQKDYSVERSRLEYIADYAEAHAEEMKRFTDLVEQLFK
jgi:hypothetical protein